MFICLLLLAVNMQQSAISQHIHGRKILESQTNILSFSTKLAQIKIILEIYVLFRIIQEKCLHLKRS